MGPEAALTLLSRGTAQECGPGLNFLNFFWGMVQGQSLSFFWSMAQWWPLFSFGGYNSTAPLSHFGGVWLKRGSCIHFGSEVWPLNIHIWGSGPCKFMFVCFGFYRFIVMDFRPCGDWLQWVIYPLHFEPIKGSEPFSRAAPYTAHYYRLIWSQQGPSGWN